MVIIWTGFKKAVKLIFAGVDVNAKVKQGQTALMIAASNGHIEIAEMLRVKVLKQAKNAKYIYVIN